MDSFWAVSSIDQDKCNRSEVSKEAHTFIHSSVQFTLYFAIIENTMGLVMLKTQIMLEIYINNLPLSPLYIFRPLF